MRIFPKAWLRRTRLVVIAAFLLSPPAAGDDDDPAYAEGGVAEVGGFAHFMVARDYSSLGIYPTFGWFPWDNVELSAIVGVNRVGQTIEDDDGDSADVSRTQVLLLAEPSFHIPFSAGVYGFLGVGFGLAHEARTPGPGAGPGFAIAPRLGLNLVIAGSGVLSPAVQASYQTTDALATQNGAEAAAHSSLGFQAGYTIFW
jgi:hypothetical protein